MRRSLAVLALAGFASLGAFAQAPSPNAAQPSAMPQSPTPDASKAAVAAAAAPKTVDVLLLNGEAFPPYPRENADVLLTAAQYRLLVNRARASESSLPWYLLDIALPFLLLVAGYLVYSRIQNRSGAKALEAMSAKPEVVALHGDVKVLLERQSQLQQLVEARTRP